MWNVTQAFHCPIDDGWRMLGGKPLEPRELRHLTLMAMEAGALVQANDKVDSTGVTGSDEEGWAKDVKWSSPGQRLLWTEYVKLWSEDGADDLGDDE